MRDMPVEGQLPGRRLAALVRDENQNYSAVKENVMLRISHWGLIDVDRYCWISEWDEYPWTFGLHPGFLPI
jgi:hypothetical protein